MKRITILPAAAILASVGIATISGLAKADDPSTKASVVGDFRLTDQAGMSHGLRYLSDKKAVVIMAHKSGCNDVTSALPVLASLREKHGDAVEVLMLNSDPATVRETVAAENDKLKTDIPVMMDPTQLVGEALNVSAAGETLVIDTKSWAVAYRGGASGAVAAVDDTVAQRPVAKASSTVKGCKLTFPERAKATQHAKISYTKTVAPLITEKCASCHQKGGIAPFAMDSYEMVKSFAPMIRESVLTARMPPWHADAHYQTFAENGGLTVAETKTLIHWIEAGAPRDKGDDPLAKSTETASQWALGRAPDLILDVPAFTVPATGTIEYQYPRVKNPLDHDVWVTAVQNVPGSVAAVHHIIVSVDDPAVSLAGAGRGGNKRIGGWAPGKPVEAFGKDSGIFVPKGSDFVVQMHYTAFGKEMVDHSKIGLYFQDAPPKYPVEAMGLRSSTLLIPPGAHAHTERAVKVWDRDIVLYYISPHAHVRGKAAKLTAVYPDGKEEVLLNVPAYDFNWQNSYHYKEPKYFKAGTKFIWDMTWDNSTQNKANPDPTQPVKWGDQTWEEMGIGWLSFRYADMTADKFLQERQAKIDAAAARKASGGAGQAAAAEENAFE